MQFPLIDLLRALAALLVMIYHVTALGQWSKFADPFWGLPFRQGWIGVDLFLVISGFVITLSAARDRDKNPATFRRGFMLRRLRRLLPLYLLTCMVYVTMVRPEVLVRPPTEVAVLILSHCLFLQNLTPYTHGVINGVTWSLALEMQFYVLLVLSIGWLVKLGPTRTFVLMTALAWAWRYATTFVLPPGQAIPHLQVIYTTQLPGTLDEFGIGIALALAIHAKGNGKQPQWLNSSWRNFALYLVICSLLLAAAGALFLPRANYWSYEGMVVFWRTLLASAFGFALAAVITCPSRGGGVLQPFQYLGKISYGLYLWHFPVLLSLLTLPNLRGGRLFVILLECSIILATASWYGMEKHWILKSGRSLNQDPSSTARI